MKVFHFRPHRWSLTVVLLFLLTLVITATAYADDPIPVPVPFPTDAPAAPVSDPAAPAPAAPAEGAPADAAPAVPVAAPADAPVGVMQSQLFARLNAIRAEKGLPPLKYNLKLETAAQVHVVDMQSHGLRSHAGSDGSQYYDRIINAGYHMADRWGAANETIGWGNNLDRQVSWWMNSTTHRNIILSGNYTEVGIGYAGDPNSKWGHWWVVDYARPAQ